MGAQLDIGLNSTPVRNLSLIKRMAPYLAFSSKRNTSSPQSKNIEDIKNIKNIKHLPNHSIQASTRALSFIVLKILCSVFILQSVLVSPFEKAIRYYRLSRQNCRDEIFILQNVTIKIQDSHRV